MLKKLTLLTLAILLALTTTVAAKRPSETPNPNSQSNTTFSLPEHAQEVAENVYYLGKSVDAHGESVEGYAFIHPKRGFHHKPDHDRGNGNSGNGGSDDDSNCYAFLSKDAKWKTNENYLVDPTNNESLDETFVRNAVEESVLNWENAATGTLDDNSSKNIFGDEVSGTVDGADTGSPDGKNEVMFGSIDSEGAIAVTIVWGRFSGPPFNRELVEWDQVYDQVDFDWTSDGNVEPNKMDFTNIAKHEVGHAFGLDHPGDTCTEQTMYAYAEVGETKKVTLELGDVTGVYELYK